MKKQDFIIFSIALSGLCLLIGIVTGTNINENMHIKINCKYNSKTLNQYEHCIKNPDIIYILKQENNQEEE